MGPHKVALLELEEPARRARGRNGDRQGRRPRDRHERGARDHGPERLRASRRSRTRSMGHPAYEITEGQILLDGEDVTEIGRRRARAARPLPRVPVPARDPGRDRDELPAHRDQRDPQGAERRRRRPDPDPGVPHGAARRDGRLKVPRELASRYLNDGFSGGEKKRVEILQMAMLKPRIAVLDETDSGLDIDALRIVAGGVKELVGPGDGRARDHALPADPRLHQARLRARVRRRPDRGGGRPRAREEARGRGLRGVHAEPVGGGEPY